MTVSTPYSRLLSAGTHDTIADRAKRPLQAWIWSTWGTVILTLISMVRPVLS